MASELQPSGASGSDTKALGARWFHEVWNERREQTIDELLSPDLVATVEGVDAPLTRDEWLEYRRALLSAVPDLRVEVLSIVADGGACMVNWRVLGTHLGPGMGIPPSGRAVDFTGVSMLEWVDGRMVRGFDKWNRGEVVASLMQVRMDELVERTRLTRREAQVALLMAERYGHTEIAEQLGIRPNTARRHCERVLGKLGAHRKQDVAAALGKIPGSVLDRHGSDMKAQGHAAGPRG